MHSWNKLSVGPCMYSVKVLFLGLYMLSDKIILVVSRQPFLVMKMPGLFSKVYLVLISQLFLYRHENTIILS